MSRHVHLLVNPTAGHGRAAAMVDQVMDRLRQGGLEVHLLRGRDEAQARELANRAVGEAGDGLVVLGGDGLVNLAAQAVTGTTTPLAIVPAGTGNDAARTLGIPLSWQGAVDVVLHGRNRAIDVGRAGERVFLSVVSSGFDSRVNERANRMTWPSGPTRYNAAMLAELRVFRPVPFEIGLDGQARVMPAMLVAVGNGVSYGGGMRVCPAADLNDGLLDVTVLKPLPTWKFLRLFPSVYRGEHVRSPDVVTARARVVTLSAPGMTAYADGEPLGPLPVTIEAVRDGLTVLVPAGTE